MKSLDEHNKEARIRYAEMEQLLNPGPNGISCPDCSQELWDSDPRFTLTSNPPQKNTHCPGCGYRGYRLA